MPQQLTVSAGWARPTPRQTIEQILEQDQQANEPTRMRLPINIYDRATKDYRQIPNMVWTLQFQGDPDGLELMIEALGKCLSAIGEFGAEAVIAAMRKSTDAGPEPTAPPVEA